jgi:hypothetical protein
MRKKCDRPDRKPWLAWPIQREITLSSSAISKLTKNNKFGETEADEEGWYEEEEEKEEEASVLRK